MIEIVKDLKYKYKLSYEEIADLLNVSRQIVYYWIRGERNPSKVNEEKLIKMHDKLQKSNIKNWRRNMAFGYILFGG